MDEAVLEETVPQRERIRRAAVRLFTRNGYEATSMKELARELGMVPANLYNYYPKKEAILYEVLSVQVGGLLERERQIAADHPDPVDRVRELAYDVVLADMRDPLSAFVSHHGLNGLTGETRDQISQLMADIRRLWIETIEEGVSADEFDTPDPKLSALTVITLCSFASSWYDPLGAYTAEDVAAHTAAAALRAVGYAAELPETGVPKRRARRTASLRTNRAGSVRTGSPSRAKTR